MELYTVSIAFILAISTAASGSTALAKLIMKPSSSKIRHRNSGKLLPLPLVLTVLVTATTPHACRASANRSSKDSDNVAVGLAPGKPVLERSLAKARQMNEYTFTSELLTYKKSKAKASSANFFFQESKSNTSASYWFWNAGWLSSGSPG